MEKMRDRQIKAVLFDFGETLVTFGPVSTTRLFREGARASYEYLKDQGQPAGSFASHFWGNLIRIHIRHLLSNITGRDFDTLALLEKVGTRKGLRLSPEQWQEVAWLWYEPLSKAARAEPEMKETLTALKHLGLKLGIVSNTFINCSSLDRHLKNLSILDFFNVRLYSYEFNFRKPNIQIFRVAAERIGESPENILYVGDRIDNDIKPAAKSGMFAVLKEAHTNTNRRIPKGILKIRHLAELPSLIEGINAGRLPALYGAAPRAEPQSEVSLI